MVIGFVILNERSIMFILLVAYQVYDVSV